MSGQYRTKNHRAFVYFLFEAGNLKIYLMYHATKAENIESIWTKGLRASKRIRPNGYRNMLGEGIYTSRQIGKCMNEGEYGSVVLKLAVYTGKKAGFYKHFFRFQVLHFLLNFRESESGRQTKSSRSEKLAE